MLAFEAAVIFQWLKGSVLSASFSDRVNTYI